MENKELLDEVVMLWDLRSRHLQSHGPRKYVFHIVCCYQDGCIHPLCRRGRPDDNDMVIQFYYFKMLKHFEIIYIEITSKKHLLLLASFPEKLADCCDSHANNFKGTLHCTELLGLCFCLLHRTLFLLIAFNMFMLIALMIALYLNV